MAMAPLPVTLNDIETCFSSANHVVSPGHVISSSDPTTADAIVSRDFVQYVRRPSLFRMTCFILSHQTSVVYCYYSLRFIVKL